jgi:hypothetical protein
MICNNAVKTEDENYFGYLAYTGQIDGSRRKRKLLNTAFFWGGLSGFCGFCIGVLTTLWIMGL